MKDFCSLNDAQDGSAKSLDRQAFCSFYLRFYVYLNEIT